MLLSATVVLLVSTVGWTSPVGPASSHRVCTGTSRSSASASSPCMSSPPWPTGTCRSRSPDAFVPFISPYRPIWVVRSPGLRPPPGRGRHQRTASLHGPARLAWRALARVRLLAGRHAPRPWVGERHPAVPRARGLPRVRGGGRRRPGLASGDLPSPSAGWRVAAAVAGASTLVVTLVFALEGPLRPGWSHRAGTSTPCCRSSPRPPSPRPRRPPRPRPRPRRQAASRRRRSHRRCRGPSRPSRCPPPRPKSTNPPGTPRHDGSTRRAAGRDAPAWRGPHGVEHRHVWHGPRDRDRAHGLTIDASLSGPGGPLNIVLELDINQTAGTVSGAVTGSSG